MTIMSKKKRKIDKANEEQEESQPSSKITKLTNETVPKSIDPETPDSTDQSFKFDVKHFRKELNSSSNASDCLSQFLNVCSKSNNSIDYVLSYLKCGGTPGEILKQLDEKNHKNVALATTVFNLFHLVLSKIHTSSPHLLQSAEDTCRYFLNSYVPIVELMLSEKSNPKQQKVILKLLTTIVMLNPELGITVLNQLSLQPKTLNHLVKCENVKEKKDVRISLIHFLMSFLVDNNMTLVKSLLDKQGLMTMIIPDLVKDDAEVVVMVLQLLKKTVINNANISKTTKIRTFSHYIIACIFNLFNWNKSQTKVGIEVLAKTKDEVEEAVSEFLLILCTSHKHGIYFTDKMLGTGDLPTNQYLLKAIESLEAPWNNEKAGQFLIKMISICPDLYKPVRRIVEDSFDPRNSEQWFKSVGFLKDMLTAITVEKTIILMRDMNTAQIVSFIKNAYLPVTILKTSVDIIKFEDNKMKNEIFILLHTMLFNIKSYMDILELGDDLDNNIKLIVKSRLEDFIPKHFPSTDMLIMNIHMILDKVSPNKGESETNESVDESRFLINILNLLLLYNEIVPNSLDPVSTMLDTKRLFQKLEFIDSNKVELKLKTTMFLLCADRFAFTPDKPLFKNILLAMFEVYLSNDIAMEHEARQVLYNILDTTGLFEKNRAEIDIVLYILHSVSRKFGDGTTAMIVNVLEDIILNSKMYDTKLQNCIDKNMEQEIQLTDNFDEIFKNIENYKKDTKDACFIQESSSLTLFLIGLLKNVKKNSASYDSLVTFCDQYIVNLIHIQNNPDILRNVLSNYNLNDDIKSYVFGWKNEPLTISKDLFNKNETFFKVSKALVKDDEISIQKIFNLKPIDDKDAEIKHINFNNTQYCIEDYIEDISEYYMILNMLLFNIVSQSSLKFLNEKRLAKMTIVMEYLIEICLQSNKFGQKNYVNIVRKCLGNKALQLKFIPFTKDIEHVFLTKFVLNVINICNKKNIEIKAIEPAIKPYKHKIYLLLSSEIQNAKISNKGLQFLNLELVLSTLKLDLNDANCLLTDILQLNISCMATDSNEPSSWIHIICHILQRNLEHNFILPQGIFNKLTILYSKIIKDLDFTLNINELEENLYKYLIANPYLIENIPPSIFDDMFLIKNYGKYASKLGALLLQMNVNLLSKFMKNIAKEETLSKREFILPLTLAAFHHAKFKNSLDILNTIYNQYKANIWKIIEKPHKASQIYIDNIDVIIKLIYSCVDVAECETFLKKTHKFDSMEVFHIDLLEAIFFKCSYKDLKLNTSYIDNFLISIFQLSNIIMKRDILQNEKVTRISRVLHKILKILTNEDNKEIMSSKKFEHVIQNPNWQNFFKFILISHLKPPSESMDDDSFCLFGTLSPIIDLIYSDDHAGISELYEMLTSHSEFLNIILSTQFQSVKKHLVNLIYTMICKNKSIMKTTHIPVYLSAYQATNAKSDQTLLKILRFYEKNGQSMKEYRPYLWGDTGANHFALRSSRKKSSLWSNPSVNHILNLLDKDKIEMTIKYFPFNAKLNLNDVDFKNALYKCNENTIEHVIDDIISTDSADFNILKTKSLSDLRSYVNLKLKMESYKSIIEDTNSEHLQVLDERNTMDIYDPAFLLPLLNFIFAPGSSVSCHRIIRGGVLAIPLMALSSNCPMMRAAAYNILSRFYSQLEAEMFYKNDKVLWSQFLDTIRCSLETAIIDSADEDSTTKSNPRLPAVWALYLARAALVMTQPLDPMFKPINNLIISKQNINFTVVPDFLDLFHNTDVLYVERRIWILKILRDGLRSFSDIKLMLKSVSFKILFDFYSCSLADTKAKLLILEVLNSTICIPKGAKILSDAYGLFPWLSTTFINLSNDNKLLISTAINLTYNLLINLTIESTTRIVLMKEDKNHLSNLLNNGRCFKINDTLHFNTMRLLIDLSTKLGGVKLNDMKKYLNTLRKISSNNIKLLTQLQILRLIENCKSVLLTNKSFCKIVHLAVENKKTNLLSNSKILIEQNGDADDEIVALRYLHEVVLIWLS